MMPPLGGSRKGFRLFLCGLAGTAVIALVILTVSPVDDSSELEENYFNEFGSDIKAPSNKEWNLGFRTFQANSQRSLRSLRGRPVELSQIASHAHGEQLLQESLKLNSQLAQLRKAQAKDNAAAKALHKIAKKEHLAGSRLEQKVDRDRNALNLDNHDARVYSTRAIHDHQRALRDKTSVLLLQKQSKNSEQQAKLLQTKGQSLAKKAKALRSAFLNANKPMRLEQIALNTALKKYRLDTMKLANAEVRASKMKKGEGSMLSSRIARYRSMVNKDRRTQQQDTHKMDHLSSIANKVAQAGSYFRLQEKATKILDRATDARDKAKDEEARSAGLLQKSEALATDAKNYKSQAREVERKASVLQSRVRRELASERSELRRASLAGIAAKHHAIKAKQEKAKIVAKKKLAARFGRGAASLLEKEGRAADELLQQSSDTLDHIRTKF